MLAPMLVQMERQIDREIAADNKANGVAFGTQTEEFDSDSEEEDDDNGPMLMYGPQPQIVTNDLKSLDEMVSSLFNFPPCGFVTTFSNSFVLEP
jgi:growth arrest-specific protein 2